jgi:hypothetical protein
MARVAEQSLITGGRRENAARRCFNGEYALRPEKTSVITVTHGTGTPRVAFWTDDPYFRLRPEVANPSALSARLLKIPTEDQVPISDLPTIFTV